MIYRIEIENFYSVRDRQVLDLTIASNVPDPENRFAPLYFGSSLRVPKVVALFGANASGKTTILKALQFLINFAGRDAMKAEPFFPVERFNDKESKSRPIKFAVEFGGAMALDSQRLVEIESGNAVVWGQYRYELELGVQDGIIQCVSMEALRQRPEGKGKWQRVFERNISGDVKGSSSFPISGYRHLLNTLQPHASVISSFALFEHPTAKIYLEILSTMISNLGWVGAGPNDQAVIDFLASNPEIVAKLNRDLCKIDVGVENMRIENGPNGPFALFRHEGLDVDMPWVLESNGTRAFIKLFPLLAMVLAKGGVAIVDEFDLMIHPLTLPEILRWFYDKVDRNPLDAQLWISCHSASLLDDLVKEEIVLCEKDNQGRTEIYGLADIKAVRRDDNFYGKYLGGHYGAVPHIG